MKYALSSTVFLAPVFVENSIAQNGRAFCTISGKSVYHQTPEVLLRELVQHVYIPISVAWSLEVLVSGLAK